MEERVVLEYFVKLMLARVHDSLSDQVLYTLSVCILNDRDQTVSEYVKCIIMQYCVKICMLSSREY